LSHTSCKLTALFGGNFDPIHNGHLYVARQLLQDPLIGELAFLPVGNHHFKSGHTVLDYQVRHRLIAKVLEPGMLLWDEDNQAQGYTSQLIQRLQLKYPGMRFGFVIGSDNLPQLPSWYDYQWLQAHVYFIVIPRPGYAVIPPDPAPQYIVKHLTPPDISSSQIRSLIAKQQSIQGLVPQVVIDEITQLYTTANT